MTLDQKERGHECHYIMTRIDGIASYNEPSSPIEMFGFCYDQIGPPILAVKSAKENETMENMGPDITEKALPPGRSLHASKLAFSIDHHPMSVRRIAQLEKRGQTQTMLAPS